jgi:hypothetical protein
MPSDRVEMGASVTNEELKQSLAEWAVYEKWFCETILREDEKSGSTAVAILPCGSSDPKYRHDTKAYVALLLTLHWNFAPESAY